MKTFQFDECLNSKRLEAICLAEGRCIPHRFPKRFKNKSIKDPEVLSHFFSMGKAIVTNDAEMLTEHLEDIPELHPGLVIVGFSDDCHDELTDEASARILRLFKSRVATWPDLHYDNSVLFLTEKYIMIMHKYSGRLQTDLFDEYSGEVLAVVTSALEKNFLRA